MLADLGRRGWSSAIGVVRQIELAAEERSQLERIVPAASSELRLLERARIVLAAAEGQRAEEIAAAGGCSLPRVLKWRSRYARARLAGLRDAPRSGAPFRHGPELRALLIAKAGRRPPESESAQRRERSTQRELAAQVGRSESQAQLILARAGLKPQRSDYWISSDFSKPEFEQRCAQVCGRQLNPPANLLVVSLDEQTSIQAKAAPKPEQPPGPGQPAGRQHGYEPNGSQCLFGALQVDQGEVIAMPSKTRNRYELIRFLDLLAAEIPSAEGQQMIAITDNFSTRASHAVTDWLTAHPRWRFQFTPTHASWLNQIEIVFAILVRKLLKHGSFTSEQELAEQMLAFVETYNQSAKPFAWTYTGKTLNA